MKSVALALVLVLVVASELVARSDQKSLGCFKDSKELFTKLNGLVYEPNKATRGGVVHFAAGNNKFRRVVFKQGPACAAGRQFMIVYDDLVPDFSTNPHKMTKKKPRHVFVSRTGEWSGGIR